MTACDWYITLGGAPVSPSTTKVGIRHMTLAFEWDVKKLMLKTTVTAVTKMAEMHRPWHVSKAKCKKTKVTFGVKVAQF